MKSFRRHLTLVVATWVASLVSLGALAQEQPAKPKHAAAHPAQAALADPAVRLAEFKAVLGLTEAQMPIWNVFEQTTLQQAAQRKQLMEAAKASGTHRTQLREQMHALREANKEHLATARKALFATFTPAQRAAARAHFETKYGAWRGQQGASGG
jgi:hypothetical protein